MGLLLWRSRQLFLQRMRDLKKGHQPLLRLDTPLDILPPLAWVTSMLICFGFLIFVCAMWTDQYQALITSTPLIDALKLARKRAQERRRQQRARMDAGEWVNAEEEDEESEEEWRRKRRTTALLVALSKACGERPHVRWLVPLKPPPGSGGAPMRWGRGLDGCTSGGGVTELPRPGGPNEGKAAAAAASAKDARKKE